MSRDYDKLLKSGNNAQLEKLKENEHKKGFDDIDIDYSFRRLHDELRELFSELAEDVIDYTKVRKEAADIANFAHMIIFKCDQVLDRTENRIKEEYYEQ